MELKTESLVHYRVLWLLFPTYPLNRYVRQPCASSHSLQSTSATITHASKHPSTFTFHQFMDQSQLLISSNRQSSFTSIHLHVNIYQHDEWQRTPSSIRLPALSSHIRHALFLHHHSSTCPTFIHCLLCWGCIVHFARFCQVHILWQAFRWRGPKQTVNGYWKWKGRGMEKESVEFVWG